MKKSLIIIFGILFALLASAFIINRMNESKPHATCYGNTPCNACKTCNYCGHCAKSGGKCGVCK